MLIHADLPDDINTTLRAMIAERDELVRGLREQLTTHAVEIEHLKLLIAKLKRMQHGRKSEKLDRQIEQLEPRLEDLLADATAVVNHDEGAEKPPRKKAPRKAIPDHLPRDEKVYLPAEQVCPLAAALCASWVKMSPNSWNSFVPVSKLLGIFVRNSPAPAVIASCKRQHRVAPLIGVCLDLHC